MTAPDAPLGPCPPMYRPRASGQSRIYSKLVTSEYADWQRRRAERAALSHRPPASGSEGREGEK